MSPRDGTDADAEILAYLRVVFSADLADAAPELRAELSRLRDALHAHPSPDYARLTAWRLLASNSLAARDPARREGWDRANAEIMALLARDEPPSFAMAATLHRRLDVGPSAIRTDRIYTADEEYLEPSLVQDALAMLDESLSRGDAPPLVRAYRAYVGIVTIHPFLNGNGRTARLLADAILMGNELLPLCFASPVSSHVARTKGGIVRDPARTFTTFVDGVTNAYRVVLRQT